MSGGHDASSFVIGMHSGAVFTCYLPRRELSAEVESGWVAAEVSLEDSVYVFLVYCWV